MTCHTKQQRTLPLRSWQETRTEHGLPTVDEYEDKTEAEEVQGQQGAVVWILGAVMVLVMGLLVAMIDLGPVALRWMGW